MFESPHLSPLKVGNHDLVVYQSACLDGSKIIDGIKVRNIDGRRIGCGAGLAELLDVEAKEAYVNAVDVLEKQHTFLPIAEVGGDGQPISRAHVVYNRLGHFDVLVRVRGHANANRRNDVAESVGGELFGHHCFHEVRHLGAGQGGCPPLRVC